ncbi:inosine-uridine preferring nucleoside hydrolase-domain-containing protein [Aspergillus cavernicola]|uniref:Inosine-uridine preferring nucleoside hydrolase-domain-containing protein n=1 Tax=Aspergillus cavernicola TaxID=176166 RepID=A0ABR4HE55_9EURO
MVWTLALVLLLANSALGVLPFRKNIIIDTDLHSDVDDAGALLLACSHPGVKLLGVNINYPSIYSGLAASSLLGYYNHAHVPLGLKRPFTNATFFDDYEYVNGEYTSKVAYNWRHNASFPWANVSGTWNPVELYRKLLSEQEDQTVTIASIGFLDNLSDLLSSQPDTYSPLTGRQLVIEKVNELVVMGGSYPSGYEFNFFGYNSTAAAHVVNTWPGAVTFIGDKVGHYVLSGARLTIEGPERDPVRAAYTWYSGYNKSRSSWDPLTVLYAVEGLGRIFRVGGRSGHNHVYPDGRNVWRSWSNGWSHHYLELAVSNETAGSILDEKFIEGAVGAAYC